jgi:ankyrin repeat protein
MAKTTYAKSAEPKTLALFVAIEANHPAAVRQAIAAGADPNAIEPTVVIDGKEYPQDWPALHKAVLEPKRDAVVRVLLEAGAKPNLPSGNYTPLELAAEYADPATLEALVDGGATVASRVSKTGLGGGSALNTAALAGQLANVKWLLARGAPIDSMDAGRMTPLHAAVMADELKIAEVMLAHGADVNARDMFGKSPLFHCQSVAIAKLLLKLGADPDAVDKERTKAFDECDDEATKRVLVRAADPAISNKPPPRGRDKQRASDQRELRKNLTKATVKPATVPTKTKPKSKPKPKSKSSKRVARRN